MIENHILNCYKKINKLKKSNFILTKIVKVLLIKYYNFILKYFFGSFISHDAKLGNGIKFQHSFHGIFISQSAVIGNNVTILHHSTIGSNISKIGGKMEAPTIEDDVFIGCNACIIGKTTIGKGSKVGAGVVITNKKIKPNSTVYVNNLTILEQK
ncbi:MAG: DapH/DapD/GlmU-related protein [Sulfurovaceae bacterium]|nr:DapH/DapD/GlmU-related protein [Sulfurovaceae bacterium]